MAACAVGGVGQAVAADGVQASVAGGVGDQDQSLVGAEARSSAC
jgi:hypothetical protein